jgi:hypothetical protein
MECPAAAGPPAIRFLRSGHVPYGNDRFGHFGGVASFFSALIASKEDGSGAVVMMASNASPFLFKLLRAISDEQGWTGFRQPAGKRWQGLPRLSGDYPVQLQYSTREVSICAEVRGAANVPISADSFWSRQPMCS